MEIKLRDYQSDAVDEINSYLDFANSKVIYQLPTGGGKTEVAITVAKEWMDDLSAPDVYWMTHRRELESQSAKRMEKAGLPSVIVSSPIRLNNAIKREDYVPGEDDLLIADEAHHATAKTWTKVVRNWPGNVLGLTATPWRLSKKEGFDHLFDHLIKGPTVQWLIEHGHLVPCVVRHPRGKFIEGFGADRTGDFNSTQSYQNNDKTLLIEEAIKWLLEERKENSKTVAYCINVQHAKELNAYALSMGLRSALVLGETPDGEREKAVDDFGINDALDLLICVEVITEGFDVPAIDSVLMLRKTMSLSLYLQMIGRAMRTAEGKEYALILDAAGNWKMHGLPEQDREWKLEARGEETLPGEAPIRICPMCNTVNHVAARVCTMCGFEFGQSCNRCGTYVYKDEQGNPRKCRRCAEDEQRKMFEGGVGTVVAAEPYNLQMVWGEPPIWGAKVFNPTAQPGDIIQIVTKKGSKFQKEIVEIVGKSGANLLVTTGTVQPRKARGRQKGPIGHAKA